MPKPFSQSCENNKQPIVDVIRQYIREDMTVLEVGSYTAQHVRFFAEQLPATRWQPTDTPDNLALVQAGLVGEMLPNILPPLALSASDAPWPVSAVEAIFSANCLHIMSEANVACFFRGAGAVLKPGGYLCVYGPFNYDGRFSSDSNARFECWLKGRDPLSGIRDFDWVNGLAQENGMQLVQDHTMPANNQLLVWQKQP